MEEKTFFKFPEQSCKVKFAAKNKIKKLEYYAANKQIDLSQLTALREVSITKDTSVKVSKKWYKKTKKKLKVYSEGFLQKKLKMKNTNLGSSSFMSRDIRKILIYVESIVIELQQRT